MSHEVTMDPSLGASYSPNASGANNPADAVYTCPAVPVSSFLSSRDSTDLIYV